MTLQQLYYLLAVSKHTSISAAAQRLGISQPSLSAALKELEREFQLPILERHHRGISFTPEGLEFLHSARTVIRQAEQLQHRFAPQEQQSATLTLTVSAPPSLFIAEALGAYLQTIEDTPAYCLTVREVRTTQVLHDVTAGQSQLGLLYISTRTARHMETLFSQEKLAFTPLASFAPHIYLSSDHPLAAAGQIQPDQLQPYPYVRFERHHDDATFADDLLLPDIQSERIIQITDRATLFRLLIRSTAYAIGTGYVPPTFADEGLCALPLAGAKGTLTYVYIQRQDEVLPISARQFLEQLSHCLKGFGL